MNNNEIKFRAWNEPLKTMLLKVGVHPHLAMDLAADDEHYLENKEGRYLVGLGFKTFKVMQFTGLKDKNGVEIYDGDILYHEPRSQKFRVFRVPGGFAVNTHQNDLRRDTPFYEGLSDMQNGSWCQCLEIIGNIYENPEYSLQ